MKSIKLGFFVSAACVFSFIAGMSFSYIDQYFSHERSEVMALKGMNKLDEFNQLCHETKSLSALNNLSLSLSMIEAMEEDVSTQTLSNLKTLLTEKLPNDIEKLESFMPLITTPELRESVESRITKAKSYVGKSS
ncbi:MAG: hypothetical protein OQK12_10700 [Motiliproteus sp.]|nr:hypothetical protein [Motiliproteus sp.]MCW9054245.1 hypothetical protein [Motiliproteus sp.]